MPSAPFTPWLIENQDFRFERHLVKKPNRRFPTVIGK
jgi:hypothetical protein